MFATIWWWLVITNLLASLTSLSSCQTILTPYRLHASEQNECVLISNTEAKAHIEISSTDQFTDSLVHAVVYFRKDSVIKWNFSLPQTDVSLGKVYMRIDFNGSKQVTHTLQVDAAHGYAILQSDKPIYRVSETVRLRAIRLDRTLMPMRDTMKIRIFNHQKIKVEEVSFDPQDEAEIIEFSYRFPSIAKPGIWMAQLLYGPKAMFMVETPLEITEYILPLFEIQVNTPKYALCGTDKKVNINTTVKYTFGKIVNGTIYYRFAVKDGNKTYLHSSTTTFCLHNGVHNYELNVEPFFNSMEGDKSYRLHIEAVVSDHVTGRKDRVFQDQMILTCEKFRIELKQSLLEYKPNIASYISFKVLDPTGEEITNASTTIELQDAKGGNRLVLVKASFQGENTYTYKLNKDVGPLKGVIKVNDASFPATRAFIVEPYDASEQAFVSIVNRSETSFKAGDVYQTRIVTTGPIKKDAIYAILISKNTILSINELDTDNLLHVELSNKMVPNVQVLVIALTNTHYVADVVLLQVQQHKCGVEVIMPKVDKVLPGSQFNLSLVGQAGDTVALQAIDQSVYLLRGKTFTKKSFVNLLLDGESRCKSTSAHNVAQVLRNAGLRAMSADGDAGTLKDNDFECFKRTKSKRASGKMASIDLPRCCELAYLKYRVRLSCLERASIIANFTSKECADKFKFCCQNRRKHDIAFSASESLTRSDPKASPSNERETSLEDERHLEKLEDQVKIVRSDFRETWLFDLVRLNKSHETFTTKIPDTITSWAISPLSISKQHGFCLHSPERITTFKNFFIKVDFPPMIVQYEHTELKVTVFNYVVNRSRVLVTFNNLEPSLCSESITPEPIKKIIVVAPNSAQTIAFPLVALKTGRFLIEVIATSYYDNQDKVRKWIIVNPPGVVEEKLVSFDLDPSNRTRKQRNTLTQEEMASLPMSVVISSYNNTQNINVTLNNDRIDYANMVPSTSRYVIMALGERFNPKLMPLEEMDKLLKKPKGCGEQNMFYMAFNLYSLIYLDSTKSVHDTAPHHNLAHRTHQVARFREKGLRYLKRALANQLMFRKTDGSFGAFERRPSSIWLTAFVLKVFCQAEPYLGKHLDMSVVETAIAWIQAKQRGNYWTDSVTLLHEKALGGNSGRYGLTSYVVIALNECQKILPPETTKILGLNQTVAKSEDYLAQKIASLPRIYTKILATYALTYKGGYEDVVGEMIKKILKESSFDPTNNFRHWSKEFATETTSYALLLMMKVNPKAMADHLPIVNWLSTKEVNSTFENTQDTVVALEALGKFYAVFNQNITDSNQVYLESKIAFNNKLKRSIRFDNANLDVVKIIDVDKGTEKIDFVTEGNALGKVELLMSYHVYNPNQTCAIDLEVKICDDKKLNVDLKRRNPLNASILFDQFPGLSKAIGHEPNEPVALASTLANCFGSSKSRRSVSSVLDLFLRPSYANKASNRRMSPAPPSDESECENIQFDPIFNLQIEANQEIRIMNVCVRSPSEPINDMAILELSMLTGFRAIPQDLEFLTKTHEDFILNYEDVKSKVTFYLSRVPFARKFCFQFRILKESKVENLQMALAKVYRYYNSESTCSRLYNDIRLSSKSSFTCKTKSDNSNECQCTRDQKCPVFESLERIAKRAEHDPEEAKRKFIPLFCNYANILQGKVKKIKNGTSDQLKMLEIDIDTTYRGFVVQNYEDEKARHIELTIHQDCLVSIAPQDELLIMHNEPLSDTTRVVHMDGKSMLYKLYDNNVGLNQMLAKRFKNYEKNNQECYKYSQSFGN